MADRAGRRTRASAGVRPIALGCSVADVGLGVFCPIVWTRSLPLARFAFVGVADGGHFKRLLGAFVQPLEQIVAVAPVQIQHTSVKILEVEIAATESPV